MCDAATRGPAAQLEIAGLIAAAAGPRADVEAIAGRLTELATRLSAAGLTAVAVDAEQAAVDVLRAAGAPRPTLDAHLVRLAGRIHARAAQLVGTGRTTEAVAEGREALAAYRDIALTSLEVDHIAVARERANLERLFEGRGLSLAASAPAPSSRLTARQP
jgi:hypothetical protein